MPRQEKNQPVGLNVFHESFKEILDRAYCDKQVSLVSEMLTKKFSENGIRVPKKEIHRMAKEIQEGATEVAFENRNNSKSQINFTDREVKKVQTEFNQWLKRNDRALDKIYKDSADATADFFFKTIRRKTREHVKYITDTRQTFQNRLQRIWKSPFDLLEMYVAYAQEITTECYNEHIHSTEPEEDEFLFEVLFRLQSRAIRIAQETLLLIKSGYADGAHARWRSLHELAIVALVIEKYGEEVAERYLAHDAVEYCKGAEQFQLFAKSLRQKAIPKREMTRIRKEQDSVIAKYGKNFRHEYGWASDALGKTKPTFADLEADVNLAKWRPYYRKASWNVHAGSSGIASSLGLLDEHQHLILIGASEYGFTDPGHGVALSLLQISSTILNRKSSLDRQVRMLVLMRLSELIGDEFFKVQESYHVG